MDTKVNMDVEVHKQITYAAEKLSISKSEVIKRLVKFFEKNHKTNLRLNRNVMYQKAYSDLDISEAEEIDFCDAEKIVFKQFHLCLNEIEYECFTDMRKFCKMSVSLIIAESVKLYLEILLKSKMDCSTEKGDTDNYRDIIFTGRCQYWQKTNSGYKFTVEWGYPDKLTQDYQKNIIQ